MPADRKSRFPNHTPVKTTTNRQIQPNEESSFIHPFIVITICLRHNTHPNDRSALRANRLSFKIMQRHYSRKAGDTTDKGRQAMITTHHNHLDRKLYIEWLRHFRKQLDLFKLKTATQTGTRNVLQQARHLGIARQLAQESPEGNLHLLHLLLIGLQVCRLKSLAGKLLLEGLLFSLCTLQTGL